MPLVSEMASLRLTPLSFMHDTLDLGAFTVVGQRARLRPRLSEANPSRAQNMYW